MSVRALAREVGVSASLVSQIENGKANPSVGTLYAIVSALSISLDELFAEAGTLRPVARAADAPAMGGGHVLRRGDRPALMLATGVRWERLTPAPDADVDFLLVTYEPGGASCPPDALMQHSGREYGLVLEGRLGATVGFDTYELEAGDSVALDSVVPHRFWTLGDRAAVVAWTIVGRAGDSRSEDFAG